MKLLQNKRIVAVLADMVVIAIGFLMRPMAIFMFKTKISECFFYKHGILCPGCGGTRCVYNFFSGNLAEAFRLQPYVFCLIWFVMLLLLLFNLDFIFNFKPAKKVLRFLTDYRTIVVLFIGFAVFGISRNFIPVINPFLR